MAQQQAEYEHYKRLKLLGEGSFGKAYLVECVSDGTLCVIKQVDLSKMSDQEKKETLKEAKILEAFNHPNIVRFREVYKTKKGKLCIVMDYADGGDLTKRVNEQKGSYFPETQILDWFTQICLGLKHVHDRKVLHRDLKCQNIFLTKTNIIKLGDFGIARVLSNTRENAKTMVGTPYYLSPEIINGKPYNFKSDIWSLGVVLYELCALKPPFDASTLAFLAMKIVKGQYNPIPSVYSKEMKNLISMLLQVDPTKRPNTNQILKTPLIQERIKKFLSDSMRIVEFSHTIIHNKQFIQGNLKLDQIKNVANEVPIPKNLLEKEKEKERQNNLPPDQQKPPLPGAKPQDKVVQNDPRLANKDVQKPPTAQPISRPVSNQVNPTPVQQQQQPQKQNYHYQQNQQQQQQPKPQVQEQYNGPKIFDVQKNQYVPVVNPNQKNPSNDIVKKDNNIQRFNSEEKLKNEAPHMHRVQSELAHKEKQIPIPDLKYKPQSEPNSREQVKKSEPIRDIKQQNLDGYNWLDNQVQNNRQPVNNNYMNNQKQDDGLNKNKWVQKQLNYDPKYDKYDPREKEKQEVLFNVNVQNKNQEKIEPRIPTSQQNRDIVSKRQERDILGGGGGGEFVGAWDFAPKKNDNVKKPTPQPKPSADDKLKKMEEQKRQDDKKKKQEELDKIERENREKERVLREKEKEEEKKKMYEDMKKRRESASREGPKFELIGAVKSEPTSEKKSKDNGNLIKDDSKKNPVKKAFDLVADEEVITKKNPNSANVERKDPVVQEKLKNKWNEPERKNQWIEGVNEVQNEIQNMLAKIQQNGILNKKDKEELNAFDGLCGELLKIVDTEEDKDTDVPDSDKKGKSDTDDLDDEDRDDEDDGEDDAEIKKPEVKPGNDDISMEYISDYTKLENLRIILEDSLGSAEFVKAYKIVKDLDKSDLNDIEEKYGKKDNYASLFPFLTTDKIQRFLPLLFTYVMMEETADR